MAVTLNASSTSNGLVATGDASGNLALQGNGTTGLTVNSSGKLVVPNIALGTASAGMLEYDGNTSYFTPAGTQRGIVPGSQFFMLNTGVTGVNSTAVQNVFGLANGVTLSSNTVYAFDYVVAMSKTAGTTAATINTGFGGTATLNSILYVVEGAGINAVQMPAALGNDYFAGYVSSAAATVITGTSTSATTYCSWMIKGTVSINTGGTFNPQYTLSAAPGGAWTVQAGSYFSIYPIGASGANINVGTWS
jgi:hypothetical protein